MRLPRTERGPRRPDSPLQYVSRSLAFCEDCRQASLISRGSDGEARHESFRLHCLVRLWLNASFSIPQRPAPEEEFYRQIEVIRRQKVMKYAVIIVRVLLGLMFAVLGSNAFLHFIPMPLMQGLPGQFIGPLLSSGYISAIAGV